MSRGTYGAPRVHPELRLGRDVRCGRKRVARLMRLARVQGVYRRRWTTRAELATAIFEWIEGWYDPRRRHTSVGDLSPVDYERRPATTADAA